MTIEEDNERRLRIQIAFPHSLEQSGGMEKACIWLANAMQQRGHTVRVSCLYGAPQKLFHPLDPEVELSSFMMKGPRSFSSPWVGRSIPLAGKMVREIIRPFSKKTAAHWNEWCEARMLRENIQKEIDEFTPDILISFRLDMTFFLLYAEDTKYPVISSFRFTPDHLMKKASGRDITALNQADVVHVQVPAYRDVLDEYGIRSRIVCIPNAIPQCSLPVDLSVEKPVYRILYAARINPEQKRQHLLVEAFARLADEFPDWQVELWGDDAHYAGGYTGRILRFVREHHLEERVHICGKTHDMASVYRRADIFCIPSAYEGFSNALGEAMSAGLPAVGYVSCPGVREMIHDGINGFLVEDGVDALADALGKLMGNRALRVRMGQAAHEAMKICAPDFIWRQWEQLIREAIASHGQEISCTCR